MAVRVCCGDSVFKASPSAPASSAERSESPSLYAVRTSTLGADGRSRSAAITAVPLMLVSSRSSTTTSGLCCWTSFKTSVPSVVRQPLARGPGVTVAVGECFLQDAVDRDLGRERAVAEVGREVELDPLVGERLVLHGQSLDDLAQGAALEARRPKRPDEVADLAERALQQLHRLIGALLRHGIAGERALEHLQL